MYKILDGKGREMEANIKKKLIVFGLKGSPQLWISQKYPKKALSFPFLSPKLRHSQVRFASTRYFP
jgi:hypothetical protein